MSAEVAQERVEYASQIQTLTPDACIGCLSRRVERVEIISVDDLAKAWADLNCHGAGTTSATIREFVFADLKTDRVEFWRCSDCGVEFANPLRSWSDTHYPAEEHSLGFDHEIALTALSTRDSSKVLDIGCATGQFVERAQSLGHRATGVDFSEEDVLTAKARGLDVRIARVNEMRAALADRAPFDVIALFQVIEHLADPDQVFSEIRELASSGATLMVGCPSDSRYTRVFEHRERLGNSDFWDCPPQHLIRWSAGSLKPFLSRHGWKITRIEYEPMSIGGAAAHLTALRGRGLSWYSNPLSRRLATLSSIIRLSAARVSRSCTGMRLFVEATLSDGIR